MAIICEGRKLNLLGYAFLSLKKDVNFANFYNATPNVFVTAAHSSKGGNLSPAYNGITAWIEVG